MSIQPEMWKLTTAALAIAIASCSAKPIELGYGDVVVTPSTDPTVLGSVPEAVVTMQVDDERVYWSGTREQPQFNGGNAAIRSCDKRDCAASVVTYTTTAPISNFGVFDGNV